MLIAFSRVDCLLRFQEYLITFSVLGLACRSEGGGGYGLPPLPPTSDFGFVCLFLFGLWVCGVVGLCFVFWGLIGLVGLWV